MAHLVITKSRKIIVVNIKLKEADAAIKLSNDGVTLVPEYEL